MKVVRLLPLLLFGLFLQVWAMVSQASAQQGSWEERSLLMLNERNFIGCLTLLDSVRGMLSYHDSLAQFDLHNRFALCQYSLGKPREATSEADSALVYRPLDLGTYLWSASLHGSINPKYDLLQYYRSGFKRFGNEPQLALAVVEYYAAIGEGDSAVAWCQRADQYGLMWGPYTEAVVRLNKNKESGWIDEESFVLTQSAYNDMEQRVFIRTYEYVSGADKRRFIEMWPEQGYQYGTRMLFALGDTTLSLEQRSNIGVSGLEVLSILQYILPDTTLYSWVPGYLTAMSLRFSALGKRSIVEAIDLTIRGFITQLFKDDLPKYTAVWTQYAYTLYIERRFVEAEQIAVWAYHLSQHESSISAGDKADMARVYADALAMQRRTNEAVSCYEVAFPQKTAMETMDNVISGLHYGASLRESGRFEECEKLMIHLGEYIDSNYEMTNENKAANLEYVSQNLIWCEKKEVGLRFLDLALTHARLIHDVETRSMRIATLQEKRSGCLGAGLALEALHEADSLHASPTGPGDELYLRIKSDQAVYLRLLGRHASADSLLAITLEYIDTTDVSKLSHVRSHLQMQGLLLVLRGNLQQGDKLLSRAVEMTPPPRRDTISDAGMFERYCSSVHEGIMGRIKNKITILKSIIQEYNLNKLSCSTNLMFALRDLIYQTPELSDIMPLWEQYQNASLCTGVPIDSALYFMIDVVRHYKAKQYQAFRLAWQNIRRIQRAYDSIGPTALSLQSELNASYALFMLGMTDTLTQEINAFAARHASFENAYIFAMSSCWRGFLELFEKTGEIDRAWWEAQQSLDAIHRYYSESKAQLTDKERESIYAQYNDAFTALVFISVGHTELADRASILSHYDDLRRTFLREPMALSSNPDYQSTRRVRLDMEEVSKRIESTATNRSLPSLQRNQELARLYEFLHSLEKQLKGLIVSEQTNVPVTSRQLLSGEALVRLISVNLGMPSEPDSLVYVAIVEKAEGLPVMLILPEGRQMETNWYDDYIRSIKHRDYDNETYARYWSSIEAHLDGVRTLYLMSDGVYSIMNPETFLRPDGLVCMDSYEIVPINSMHADRHDDATSRRKSATLLGFPTYPYTSVAMLSPVLNVSVTRSYDVDTSYLRGNSLRPLPGTKAEVLAIDSILQLHNWNTTLLLGDAATKKNLRDAGSGTIIHIATHGYFARRAEKKPRSSMDILQLGDAQVLENTLLASGVFLSGANAAFSSDPDVSAHSAEGVLSAFELNTWDLTRTDLVILSACETGLGYPVSGQSVYGLQRALHHAGVREVIQSLWVVDDLVTKELMVDMYGRIARGVPYRTALQASKKAIRILHPDPFFWGAFIDIIQ